jgi:hypothetical protein
MQESGRRFPGNVSSYAIIATEADGGGAVVRFPHEFVWEIVSGCNRGGRRGSGGSNPIGLGISVQQHQQRRGMERRGWFETK